MAGDDETKYYSVSRMHSEICWVKGNDIMNHWVNVAAIMIYHGYRIFIGMYIANYRVGVVV